MRLITVDIINFQKIRVAHLVFKRRITKFVAKNKQGKTSAINAIAALIGGERLCPAVPIREGEDFAEVTGNFDDFFATRKFGKGAGLQLKDRNGIPIKSPQTFLDRISKRAFDPFAFFRADPAEQYEILRRLVGIDWTAKDLARDNLYGQRTLINRDAEQIKGALARMPVINAPDDYVDVAALIREQDAILVERRRREEEKATAIAAAEQAWRDAEKAVEGEQRRLGEIWRTKVAAATQAEREQERKLEAATIFRIDALSVAQLAVQKKAAAEVTVCELEIRLAAARDALAMAERDVAEKKDALEPTQRAEEHERALLEMARGATSQAKAEPIGQPAKDLIDAHYAARSRAADARSASVELPSLDAVRAKLSGAETINTAVRAKRLRDAEEAKHRAKESEANALTRQIYAIDKSKMDDLAAAHFPIPALSISETDVGGGKKRTPTLNGLPLEQASSAEQWGVAIAMGIAEHPELRLMWIKDGSLLDNDALAQIEAAAEAADAQVIIEAVSADGVDRGEGIFIVEGEVVAIDGVPVAKSEARS